MSAENEWLPFHLCVYLFIYLLKETLQFEDKEM